MKGLVLEKQKNKVVVLTPDGRFMKVRVQGAAEVGTECEFGDADTHVWKQGKVRYVLAAAALVFMVCAVYAAYSLNMALTTVCAYVCIDINPSVELGINRFDTVITAECLNSDAENMLQNTSLTNMKLDKAVEVITQKAMDSGFINSDKENDILISSSVVAERKARIPTDALVSAGKKVLEREKISADIQTVEAEESVRAKAREAGLSIGKYIIYRQAVSEGLQITPEDIRDKNLNKAIRYAGGNYRDMVLNAKRKVINEAVKNKNGEFRRRENDRSKERQDTNGGSSKDDKDKDLRDNGRNPDRKRERIQTENKDRQEGNVGKKGFMEELIERFMPKKDSGDKVNNDRKRPETGVREKQRAGGGNGRNDAGR